MLVGGLAFSYDLAFTADRHVQASEVANDRQVRLAAPFLLLVWW